MAKARPVSDHALQKFAPRFRRLLSQDIREEDISQLFKVFRSSSPADSIVLEIGDLIAHAEGRDRGLTLKRIQNHIASAEWTRRRIREGAPRLDAEWRTAVLRTTNNFAERPGRNQFGLTGDELVKKIRNILSRFRLNADQTYVLKRGKSLTEDESTLLGYMQASGARLQAFEIEKLMQQLRSLLEGCGLLNEGDTARFDALETPIGLFVIAQLHGATIKSKDKFFKLLTKLKGPEAGREHDPHPIKYGSIVVVAEHDSEDSLVNSVPVFAMYGPLEKMCDSDLLTLGDFANATLELSGTGKLTAIS